MANDADNAVKILIDFGLDPSKADEAVGLIQKIKKEGQDMGMPEGWQGMEKYKNVLSEASNETHALHGSTRQLQMLMRQGGPVAMEFGHLLHIAFNPALLAGAALAGGLELYFHWLTKSLERQREMNVELEKYNLYVRDLIKLKGDVNELEVEHAKHLAASLTAARGLSAEIEHTNSISKMFAESEKMSQANREAGEKRHNDLLEDKIKLMESLGLITSPQAEQMKLKAEHDAKLEEIQKGILEKKAAASTAGGDLEDFVGKLTSAGYRPGGNKLGGYQLSPDQVAAADDKLDTLKNQAAFYEGITKNGAGKLAELNKGREEAEAHRSKHGTEYDAATGKLKGQVDSEKIAELDKQIAGQKKLIEDAKANLQRIENAVTEAQDTANVLHSANKTLRDLFNSLATATAEYKNAQSQGAQNAGAENQKFAMSATEANLKNEDSNQIISHAIDAANELNGMKAKTGFSPEDYLTRGNPQQQAYIRHLQDQTMALQNLETAIGQSGPAQIALLNSIVAHHGSHVLFVRQLQAQINAIGSGNGSASH